MRSTRGDERGAATVLVLAVAGVLVLVAAALAAVQGMVVAHRRAQSAADLAALAGAMAVAEGQGPCQAAGEVAFANGAELDGCAALPAGAVEVRVSVPGPHLLGEACDLHARARAGP